MVQWNPWLQLKGNDPIGDIPFFTEPWYVFLFVPHPSNTGIFLGSFAKKCLAKAMTFPW